MRRLLGSGSERGEGSKKSPPHRFQAEVRLGILGIIFLLLSLNFMSNFLIFNTRSSRYNSVTSRFEEAARDVTRTISEQGETSLKGEVLSNLMQTYFLTELCLLPSSPVDDSPESRRGWFSSVVDSLPPESVPILAGKLLESDPETLNRGDGVEYFYVKPILTPSGKHTLLLSRQEPELARLDRNYHIALVMTLIALVATAGVYVLLSRLIFSPFRKIKAEALSAGRAVDRVDDDVDSLLADYRQMIDELRDKEQELLRLNEEITKRADSLEQFNRYLLASMRSGLITVDCSGTIRTVNATACRIFRWLESAIVGQNFRETLAPWEELVSDLRETLDEGEGVGYREVALTTSAGQLTLGISSTIVTDTAGNPVGAALLLHEITELTHLRTQLELRNRLAALGEMSGGLAHQLRNSMGAISGYLTLLKKRLQKRSVEESVVTDLINETTQADHLVRRFLEFARPLQLDPQTIPLRDLVAQTVDAFAIRSEYSDIEVTIGPLPNVTIEADSLLLKQALTNLLENAAHAYPERQGRIDIDGQAAAGWIAVRVTDHGCGIPTENLQKIFTPFFSSRPSGTGLGLPLVNKIIDLHRGRIEVQSRLGQGSTFAICLPMTLTDADRSAPKTSAIHA